MSKELVTIEGKKAEEIFTPDYVDIMIAQVKKNIGPLVFDVNTEEGRKQIRANGVLLNKISEKIDNIGKEYVAELKALPKIIDQNRKKWRDAISDFREESLKPLTKYNNEQKRIDQLELNLQAKLTPLGEMTSDQIQEQLNLVQKINIDSIPENRKEKFIEIHLKVLNGLTEMLDKRLEYEVEQEELEQLRAEKAELERKEQQEEIARKAREETEKAAEERIAKAKREQERAEEEKLKAEEKAKREKKEAEERAEHEKKEALQKQKEEQERKIEAEKASKRKREEDEAHVNKIRLETLQSLIDCDVKESEARKVVALLAAGLVKNAKIIY